MTQTERWKLIWERIDQRRVALAMSKEQLYDRAGVSERTFSKMRRDGEGIARPDKRVAIARALRWVPDALEVLLQNVGTDDREPTIDGGVGPMPLDVDMAIAWLKARRSSAAALYAEFGDGSSWRDQRFFEDRIAELERYAASLPRFEQSVSGADQLEAIRARLRAEMEEERSEVEALRALTRNLEARLREPVLDPRWRPIGGVGLLPKGKELTGAQAEMWSVFADLGALRGQLDVLTRKSEQHARTLTMIVAAMRKAGIDVADVPSEDAPTTENGVAPIATPEQFATAARTKDGGPPPKEPRKASTRPSPRAEQDDV